MIGYLPVPKMLVAFWLQAVAVWPDRSIGSRLRVDYLGQGMFGEGDEIADRVRY